MRLLPRTTRGTWLLAAVTWAGVCAVAWWLLPPRPRAAVRLDGWNRVVGVSPGGRTVVLDGMGESEFDVVPVRVWDTAAGVVRTIISRKPLLAACAASADGRWVAAGVGPKDQSSSITRVRVIDLATGREDELAASGKSYELAAFSPDSRWLAVREEYEDRSGVRLWNLAGRVPGPFLANARPPVAFSADGRRLATSTDLPDEIDATEDGLAVWDTATGGQRTRLRVPRGYSAEGFTADGGGLVTGHFPEADSLSSWPQGFVCRDLADGRERWSVANVEARVWVDGGRRVVTQQTNSTGLRQIIVIDTADGRALSRFPLTTAAFLRGASRNGRAVLIGDNRPAGLDVVWAWLARYNLPAPRLMTYGGVVLLDAMTGRHLMELRGVDSEFTQFAPDGESFVSVDAAGDVTLWELSSQKPLTWFAAAAAALALPFAWLARRRVRRLRCLSGATA